MASVSPSHFQLRHSIVLSYFLFTLVCKNTAVYVGSVYVYLLVRRMSNSRCYIRTSLREVQMTQRPWSWSWVQEQDIILDCLRLERECFNFWMYVAWLYYVKDIDYII